jgi:uncharacterized protein YbcC (UPF0753/DUF2309 family)
MTHATLSPPGLDDATPSMTAAERVAWHQRIEAACAQACSAIAPAWPLDQSIAVNPHWQRVGLPLRRVAARMAVLGGMQVFPPRSHQRQAWAEGRIAPQHLQEAVQRVPQALAAGWTAQHALAELQQEPTWTRLPLLIDVLDSDPERHRRLSWRQAVTHQVSQTCAAYFDECQADWQPERTGGLYAFWRDSLQHDHGIGMLMGLPQLGRKLGALPATRRDAEHWALERLGLPEAVWADYLESVLLTVNGWASWCAYLGWQARQAGGQDDSLRELLAIRLAWGAVLLECQDDTSTRHAFAALQASWRGAERVLAQAERALLADEVWQVALELGYQRPLLARLSPQVKAPPAPPATVEVQAAFCIDVRSEPLRRAMESTWPGIRTLGFAGFFGLPVAYTPLATEARRPQLPGLLAPAMEVQDQICHGPEPVADPVLTAAAAQARHERLAVGEQWRAASRWPGAAFSYVEATGLGYLGKLGRWLQPSTDDRPRDDLHGLPARYKPVCRPQLADADVGTRSALAARVLRAMGLARHLAPLVLLVGHGSQSANNAHAAALDCGACCGQTGEVNARTLAWLLNDPAVRKRLRTEGVQVPAETWFVACLHNTTTDELEPFDLDVMPPAARERWERLQSVLMQASDQVRRERAPKLGLNAHAPQRELLTQLRRRANDGAETRPEWGLAGNAAFIIAPRARTAGVTLDGRTFLHDYDALHDADGSLLELLMTAPMLVTHWINWQYHASTCEPALLGSGNKVLHNVVGGRIGVFEGNGGDLRIGLSRQSLHDGQRWVHEPLRLTVVIDAPVEAIERVIGQHEVVRQLVDNGWLHLWQWGTRTLRRYDAGQWHPMDPDETAWSPLQDNTSPC